MGILNALAAISAPAIRAMRRVELIEQHHDEIKSDLNALRWRTDALLRLVKQIRGADHV